jgi:hypothetical protein
MRNAQLHIPYLYEQPVTIVAAITLKETTNFQIMLAGGNEYMSSTCIGCMHQPII